jgi:hypothetical protein
MKAIAMIALAVVAMTGTAMAQNSASASSAVTGTVQVPLTMVNQQGLNFGNNLQRSTMSSISVNSAQAARFFIQGDAGDRVAFTIPPTVTLTLNSTETQTLAGVNAVGGQGTTLTVITHGKINTVNNPAGAVEILPAPDELSTPGTNPTFGGDGVVGSGTGQLYLFIGGDVTPSATQQRGAYAGTINVSVNYSN